MISFKKRVLDNGLTVIVSSDKNTPIVAFNLLYKIGSRDEHPDKTGFAHLFEHLMFSGSKNIPKFDTPVQQAGGQSNAFTSKDVTNFYMTLPYQNIETAFWLESDRMNELAFSKKGLDVQRNVVIEEFNQSYLNRPYGDVWQLMSPLAYKVHPYLWNTIGKEPSHIEQATMEDVKTFFYNYYRPNNAILSIVGNVNEEEMFAMADKWFGAIPSGNIPVRNLPKEPLQTEARILEVTRKVEADGIYKAYHCGNRIAPNFYPTDLLSDLFSNGRSSILYQNLIKNNPVFHELDAFITGTIDDGLFVISGKPIAGIRLQEANQLIENEINNFLKSSVNVYDLEKVKNKSISILLYSEMNALSKAKDLAYAEFLSDASMLNEELDKYLAITSEDIYTQAEQILTPTNCSSLYYFAEKL
jgi:predicted Zn-dependent peptidase